MSPRWGGVEIGEESGYCTCDGPDHDPLLSMSCGRLDHRRDARALLESAQMDVCSGAGDCPSDLHVHGCFADVDGSRCTDPGDHPQPTD